MAPPQMAVTMKTDAGYQKMGRPPHLRRNRRDDPWDIDHGCGQGACTRGLQAGSPSGLTAGCRLLDSGSRLAEGVPKYQNQDAKDCRGCRIPGVSLYPIELDCSQKNPHSTSSKVFSSCRFHSIRPFTSTEPARRSQFHRERTSGRASPGTSLSLASSRVDSDGGGGISGGGRRVVAPPAPTGKGGISGAADAGLKNRRRNGPCRNLAPAMSEPRAPRFSDAALKVLVEQVRAHKEVLFPADGRKMPRQTLRQAWREVALYVNLKSITPRTWLQCRKKFNDLTRTARDKLAHKPRNLTCTGERPASIQATTQVEQEALDIVEIYSRRSIENGEAGGQVPQDLSHYLGLSGQEVERDCLTEDALSPAPSFQYTTELSISGGRDGTGGSAQSELFSNSEQDLAIVARTIQETDDRKTSSESSDTEEHRNMDLSGPAFKRKILHVHHQLLEALDSLSRSCLTLSESVEESASILCGVLPQGLASLQSTMENVANSLDATVKPSVQDSVGPALASLIEAQTGAIHALACTISSGLERLGGCIDRGFNHVTELLQSTFPHVSGNVESQSCDYSRVGEPCASASLNNSMPVPLPCPQFQASPVPAATLQSIIEPRRPQTHRERLS
ncbi:uncharacterized protein [Narcine bancroftii]|uniref:uncharacterized protein n=1 Tax=Narcine bancroftii TaxID=1343680 RepID=UPI003831B46E